jgi:outer membrane protein TolC
MTRRLPRLAPAFALLLCACQATAPDLQRAEFLAPPAMERTIARSGAKTAPDWPQEQWWRRFRSGELDQLMDKALADNQGLHRAADRLRQVEAVSTIE